jgi:xanthine/uracil/vitamin C permease (AzgA family)
MIRKTMAALLAATLLVGMTASTALAARPVVVLATILTGAAERPGPGDEDGIGAAVVIVIPRTDTVCWLVTWNRVDGTVVAGHIHGPTNVSDPAPVVVPFFMGTAFAGKGIHHGCLKGTGFADDIAADPELFYVNIHSAPGFIPGAIRGQLG